MRFGFSPTQSRPRQRRQGAPALLLRSCRSRRAVRRLRASVADPGGAAPPWLLALAHPRRTVVNGDGRVAAPAGRAVGRIKLRSGVESREPLRGRPLLSARGDRWLVIAVRRELPPKMVYRGGCGSGFDDECASPSVTIIGSRSARPRASRKERSDGAFRWS